jgi:hypothetical protein
MIVCLAREETRCAMSPDKVKKSRGEWNERVQRAQKSTAFAIRTLERMYDLQERLATSERIAAELLTQLKMSKP